MVGSSSLSPAFYTAKLTRPGDLHVRHGPLDPSDVTLIDGLPVPVEPRTSFDLARHLPLIEAVAATDALMHSGLVRQDRLHAYVRGRRGWHGVVQARRVVQLAEAGAESLMESVLRMLLLQRGCPRPTVHHWICGRRGKQIGRVDIWYEQAKLAVENAGEWHRHSLADDNRRQNLLFSQGVRLLRFTASDVFQRPDVVVAQVRAHL